jgi:7-cyano-7-deazaguanine synthase
VTLYASATGTRQNLHAIQAHGWRLLMLAHAVNYAASIGAAEVQFGAIADDQRDYPDCRPEFVAAVSGMAAPWGIRVSAPLIGMSKAEVIAEARARDVLETAWSCYTPTYGSKPCGTCASCVARERASSATSAADPVRDRCVPERDTPIASSGLEGSTADEVAADHGSRTHDG